MALAASAPVYPLLFLTPLYFEKAPFTISCAIRLNIKAGMRIIIV